MLTIEFDLPDESAVEQLAKRFAPLLPVPLVFTFSGEIGAGKTTFIRALLKALDIKGAIKSPTFSLVESYQLDHIIAHHFDLYRIHDESELDYIGFRDYFTSQSFCCIEWPERVPKEFIAADVHFTLSIKGNGRLMKIQSLTGAGNAILSSLQDNYEKN